MVCHINTVDTILQQVDKELREGLQSGLTTLVKLLFVVTVITLATPTFIPVRFTS